METSHRENLTGILLMVASMLCFAIEDMFIKQLSDRVPSGEILFLLGIGGFTIFAIAARRQRTPVFSPDFFSTKMIVRNTGEVLGTGSFVLAVWLVPLSTASAILQATPLAVTLGAALFLGHEVGWRRWLAIFVGFGGVLIVIRPGLEGFRPASLLAVSSVVGLAVRDVVTRAMPKSVSNMYMSAWGFGIIAPIGLIMLAIGGGAVIPEPLDWLRLAVCLTVGPIGYYMLITAMRVGEVAVVTPFRYTRLIYAIIFGMTVFGERLDRWTIIGSAIIIASGLFTIYREQRARKAAQALFTEG